mmetsp:Transcript_42999/g.98802  ORF Transcript_42999/g.98802 Transcript_42999/m.98802 type:complete len:460 (-) Transcript_42999:45-1424(-)
MGASWLENPDALRLQERQRRHYLDHCFRARTPKAKPLWCDESPPRPRTPQTRRPASGATLRRPKSAAAVISTGHKQRPDSAPSRAVTATLLTGGAADEVPNHLRMPLVPVTVLQVLETRALQKRLLAYSGMPDARASPVLQQQRQKLLQGLSRRARKAPKKDGDDESPMVALFTASKMDRSSSAQGIRAGPRFSDTQRTHSGMMLNMPLSPHMIKRPSKEVVQDMGTFSFQLPSSSRRPSKAGGDSEGGGCCSARPQSALKSTLKVSLTGDIEIPQLPLPDTPTDPNMPALPGSLEDSDEQSDRTKPSGCSGGSSVAGREEYGDEFEKPSDSSDAPARESALSEPCAAQKSPSEASQATIKDVEEQEEQEESEYDDAFEKESEGGGDAAGNVDAADVVSQRRQQADLGGYNEATSIPPQSSTSQSYESNQFEDDDEDGEIQGTSFPAEHSLESVGSSLS